jgi:uncharacterized YigZ family protein
VSDTSSAYRAPASPAEAELRERGSRFRAFILPVDSEEAAASRRQELAEQFVDATHHVWAQRIGMPPIERSHDAGEPAGTAGAPVLRVLRGSELSDVLAVVVRWYGGTKLGKGGLARAYANVTRAALERAATARRVPTVELELDVGWNQMGTIERLIHSPVVVIVAADYGERVHVRLRIHREKLGAVRDALRNAGIMS